MTEQVQKLLVMVVGIIIVFGITATAVVKMVDSVAAAVGGC